MTRPAGLDVLIVEDDPSTAKVMAMLLGSIGGEVRWSKSVAEGIEAISREPCVMILDLLLPDGSGVEVLKACRASGWRSKVAIVSAANDLKLLAAVEALRPDAVFGKPLEFDDFVNWFNSVSTELPPFCYTFG